MTKKTALLAELHTVQYRSDPSERWLAAVDEGRALLVRIPDREHDAVPDHQVLWHALRNGDGLQGILDALTAGGLSATPHFALLSWTHTSVRVFVRGDAVVKVRTHDGEQMLSGEGVSTWLEQTLEAAHSFAMLGGIDAENSSSASLLPLLGGVVFARTISSSLANVSVPANASTSVELGASKTAQLSASRASAGKSATPRVTDQAPPIGEPVADPAAAEQTIVLAQTLAHSDVISSHEAEQHLSASSDAHLGDRSAEDDESFDQLFGATIVHGVQAAGRTHAPEPSEAAPDSPTTPASPPATVRAVTIVNAVQTAPEPSQTAGLGAQIELPSFITGQIPVAATAAAGDHDGETIMSDDLRALRRKAAKAASKSGAGEHEVLSYHLVMPNGSLEQLTVPIIIGRAPSVSQVSGGKLPRLISVGSADQDISRSHLQFELAGDTVVVTDLQSRNGTLISLPGKEPQRLRSAEPTAIVTGTVIDLGGGVVITLGASA